MRTCCCKVQLMLQGVPRLEFGTLCCGRLLPEIRHHLSVTMSKTCPSMVV